MFGFALDGCSCGCCASGCELLVLDSDEPGVVGVVAVLGSDVGLERDDETRLLALLLGLAWFIGE